MNNANWSTVFNKTCMKDKISEVVLVKSVSVEKSGLYAELKYKKEFDWLNCSLKNKRAAFSMTFDKKEILLTGR